MTMTTQAPYSKHPLALAQLAQPNQLGQPMGNKLVFIGLDLAPSDTMDSGLVALDRTRQLLRTEKLAKDTDIIRTLDSVAGASNIVLVVDVPKSLSIPGKYRREEVQMHPLRLMRPEVDPDELVINRPRPARMRFYKGRPLPAHLQEDTTEDHAFAHRSAKRARTLYDSLTLRYPTMVILLQYNAMAKPRYQLHVPFKSNSTAGSKALQTAIAYQLGVGINPPSSGGLLPMPVLEAAIPAYVAWSLYAGAENEHFTLYTDDDGRHHVEAVTRVPEKAVVRPVRNFRRRYQRR
jgi:hypothetical protein